MEWLMFVVATFFLLAGAACLVLVVIGLPGGWIMVALAGVIEYVDRYYLPEDERQTFQWWVFGACIGLLLVGEALEFLAGVAGAKRGGATRRGMIGSLIGGIIGVFAFAGLFSIIPFVGTVFGAFFGALLGTFLGALAGEYSAIEGTMRGSVKPAFGATVGRVVGTASKMGIAIAVWLVLSFCAFWP
jgi:hypothetical protein